MRRLSGPSPRIHYRQPAGRHTCLSQARSLWPEKLDVENAKGIWVLRGGLKSKMTGYDCEEGLGIEPTMWQYNLSKGIRRRSKGGIMKIRGLRKVLRAAL